MKKASIKKTIILTGILLGLYACRPANNQSELERLIKERDALNEKIDRLRAERSAENGAERFREPVPVQIKEVALQEFRHFITVQGTVESESNILVSPQTPGLVQTLHVRTGDRVTKGQILAELDASVIQRSIEEVKNGLVLARTVFERRARLWEKNIGSEIEYLQAKNNKEALEKKLLTLQEQYQMTLITAPISGTIDEVMIKEGEMAAGGYGAFRIVQLSRLKITASLSENHITRIEQQDIAQISIPVAGIQFEQRLHAVSQVIDPDNRTFDIEILIPRTIKNIKPNMLAVVTINDYTNPQALVVPRNIIQKTGENNFIFVAEQKNGNMVARKRVITTGEDYANRVEITGGLSSGENVIVFGFQNLGDGQPISINGTSQ
ncbi:MAG: efflux RND transporter periplasmic adaptor subunit [Candidatus Aminicenantes bacterium]|nr:efflux RND transporter periplasmic adaptor subunit [Candidatus Aminicenantes bacterium]